MGFWNIAGEFAKGFAQGYVEERGLKGTIEDVSELASSLFSSDDDDSIVEEYNELMENEDYAGAQRLIRQYYDENDLEKDYLFYYYLGHAQRFAAVGDSQKLREAKNNLTKAYRKCPLASDASSAIQEEIKEVEESIRFLETWNRFCNDFDKLVQNRQYAKAIEILNKYYKEHEGNEFDFYYWRKLFEVYFFYAESKELKLDDPAINEMSLAVKKMRELADDGSQNEDARKAKGMLDKILADIKKKQAILEAPAAQQKLVAASAAPAAGHNGASDDEKEYLEEIKACLADDGVITDRERRLLDRLRKSLGITEERAAELEAMAQASEYSDEEREYLDEIKACLADDGVITDRERRLLDRLRKSLGIAEERAAELEAGIK